MRAVLSRPKLVDQIAPKIKPKSRTHPKRPAIHKLEIVSILLRVSAEVAGKIDCTKCANCCKEMGPRLSKRDVGTISQFLGFTPEMVVSKYLKERKDKAGEYLASKIPCPFLKKNRCSIYKVRPKGCKSYPHIKNAESILRLVDIAGKSSICPIIAGVMDQLKAEISNTLRSPQK